MMAAKFIENEFLRQFFQLKDGVLYWIDRANDPYHRTGPVHETKCGRYSYLIFRTGKTRTRLPFHRVVFQLHYGVELNPMVQLDHIDKNAFNNSPENLRVSTPHLNTRNRTNSGIRPTKEGDCYRVRLRFGGEIINFGVFDEYHKAAKLCDGIARFLDIHESLVQEALEQTTTI